jgi:hypothetical protein
VQKSVLLRQVLTERQGDLDLARANRRELGAECLHQALAAEAGANALLVNFSFHDGLSRAGRAVSCEWE